MKPLPSLSVKNTYLLIIRPTHFLAFQSSGVPIAPCMIRLDLLYPNRLFIDRISSLKSRGINKELVSHIGWNKSLLEMPRHTIDAYFLSIQVGACEDGAQFPDSAHPVSRTLRSTEVLMSQWSSF